MQRAAQLDKCFPQFKGFLVRRRCDSCGARIGLKKETVDRYVFSCPHCHREYFFCERSD